MDDRPYLSIGDVLALLQREFPDVTISKIRFLESRGLLVPDRTPSGYRKFYEHDVERLRWILRQQREHFLPLKVIKGRLEGQEPPRPPALFEVGEPAPTQAGGYEAGAPPSEKEAVVSAQAAAVSPAGAEAVEADAPPASGRFSYTSSGRNGMERSSGNAVLASVPAGAISSGTGPEGPRQGPGSSSSARQARSARAGSSAGPGQQLQGADPQRGAGTKARPLPGRYEASDPEDAKAADGGAPTEAPPSPASAPSSTAAPSGVPSRRLAKDLEPSTVPDKPGGEPAAPMNERTGEPAALVGVTLTAAEMAQASGLEPRQVSELESFGLIETKSVAGVRCYDETALVIAGLAASFSRFGMEARHLRAFKYAAERQTGLYSQIVLPLLRQRNPDARRRALEDIARLIELGASLQACFAKAALRDLTGG